MKKIKNTFIISLVVFSSCKKEQPANTTTNFSEGFEAYVNFDTTLFADNLWNTTQKTLEENMISIDTNIVHSGNRSLKCFAVSSSDKHVSKCSLIKGNMYFIKDDVVHFSAWYYVNGVLSDLYLVDFEEPAQISSSPGVRVRLSNEGYLSLERGKIGKQTIFQDESTKILFPQNQWVHVEVELKLSRKKGSVKIWQDGVLLIDKNEIQTMPKDFATFTQGTRGIVNNFEIGITANGFTGNNTTLYVDDIVIQKIN